MLRFCNLRNGVNITPQFLLFSIAIGGPSANEYSPQLSNLLYNCKLKNKEALQYFEGLSEDGGRAGFLKTFCASLFNDLSNESNFSRIHLAGQYLQILFLQTLKVNPHRLAQNKGKPFFINMSYD
jgi:hypothetical protein